MLKDLLLQFFLSVLPVFSFLLWHDKERGWKGFAPFISVASGIAILLCLLTTATVNEYEVDFRIVPFLIGSLYGGYRALGILTLMYAALKIPTLDNTIESVSFLVFISFTLILMLIIIRRFHMASAARKEKIALLAISAQLAIALGTMSVIMYRFDIPWTLTIALHIVMAFAGMILAVWLSVFIIEGVKEKQLLHNRVNQLTISNRNEVEKLQQFIDVAPLAVLMVDEEGRIAHANEESLRLLCLRSDYTSVNSLVMKPYNRVFLHPDDIGAKLLDQGLQGDAGATMPYTEDDKMLLYTVVTLRDSDNHEVTGAALIAQDITELNKLRDEIGRMERLSLVGQMAASITHEIRNPMAVIRGFVQLIQERSPKDQFEYFRIIMDELDRANLIISDFLSLAQNRELVMEKGSINTIITDLEPLLLADANLRGQSMEVNLCKDLPLMKLNDREMKQLLLNLARNGMEAMGEKGILRIWTAHQNNEVSVHVSDEGVGISPDKMKNMFEPFFTTKTRGTGLGLPLCLSIAERHGGRIDVQSEEGKGTTFIVTFIIMEERGEHNNP
ncbi:histidine kinase [Paenibacillus nanensis]|uniref:histidine kinase n=1 Tax=Paenibacillus nanensis TaxID=393251 RepID=A0A3A1V3D7_9BACL|nr:ATP-binding protein [Paenibacillus nanensis]RIX53113.1 histidine kinase [Paenibacillus nanensis]